MTSAIDSSAWLRRVAVGAYTRKFAAVLSLLMIGLMCQPVLAQFGTGADGPATISGTVTLVGPMNYTKLWVQPGAILNTAGFTVYVKDTLLNQGTITDLNSGGNGGPGGPGGAPGFGVFGHTPPQMGGNPTPGSPGALPTSGNGGSGGYGGSGGGCAWNTTYSQIANAGVGGIGGTGGKGGGTVKIYAAVFNNQGVIEANGQDGTQGGVGAPGQYVQFSYLIFLTADLGGGGGGGGGAGSGGDGGRVEINYGTMVNPGGLAANGGNPGPAQSGGPGVGQSYDYTGSDSQEPGAFPNGNGGQGGPGSAGLAPSGVGGLGAPGSSGLKGLVLTQHVSCCTGTTGNVNMAGIVDLGDLSMLIAYLINTPKPTLPCPEEANINAIGIIDLSDLSMLIAYLTASPAPTLPTCP